MRFRIIVAADDAWGIGKDNQIPWRIKEDMARFKQLTVHRHDADRLNAVIMGRKTWDGLPGRFRPLPGRYNIVMTRGMRQAEEIAGNAAGFVARDFDSALCLAGDLKVENTWVIGGAEIYSEALRHPECAGLEITRVVGKHECDVFFPHELLAPFWRSYTETPLDMSYRFETWLRQPERSRAA